MDKSITILSNPGRLLKFEVFWSNGDDPDFIDWVRSATAEELLDWYASWLESNP